jgi:hypothetical protein
MAQNQPKHIPLTQVALSFHEIAIEITTQNVYPDVLDDLSNRAYTLLDRALNKAKEQGIDVRRFNYSETMSDLEDEEEDEDEDAE